MIAGLHVGDAGVDGRHRAGGLVAEEERVVVADGAGDDSAGDVVQTGPADAAGGDVRDDLSGAGVGDDDVERFGGRTLGA